MTIALPVGPARPAHLRRPTGSGSSRPTPWPSAACSSSVGASPTTWVASGSSSSACSASPAPRRSAASPNPGHAVRRPCPPGRLRRPDGPGRPVAHHGDLHRAQGAGQGVRRLRRHRRRRRGHRADPRRRAHRVRLVALVPAGQRARSPSSTAVAAALPGPREPGPRQHQLRHPRRRHRSPLGLVALVYGFTKAAENGWAATTTIILPRSPPSCCSSPSSSSRSGPAHPLLPHAGRPRAQPGRVVPGLAAGRAPACSGCSCSSPTTSRATCTTRP